MTVEPMELWEPTEGEPIPPLVTLEQAEAYADERVAQALEELCSRSEMIRAELGREAYVRQHPNRRPLPEATCED